MIKKEMKGINLRKECSEMIKDGNEKKLRTKVMINKEMKEITQEGNEVK